MESLDRNTLNTEIVQLRHEVQRVKTLVLRNLVRKADQLRRKKGKEENRLKNEKKAERLLQEVREIKKVKAHAVTKFAIKNSEEDCLKTIANAEAPINVKCLARVACEKSFVLKLKKLEDKYYNWQDAATFLLPVKKTKKKKIKRETKVSTADEGSGSDSMDSEGAKGHDSEDDSEPDEESSSEVVDSEVSDEEGETESTSSVEDQSATKNSISVCKKTKEVDNKSKQLTTNRKNGSESGSTSPVGEKTIIKNSLAASNRPKKVSNKSNQSSTDRKEKAMENLDLASKADKKEKISEQNNLKTIKVDRKTEDNFNVAVVRKIRNLEDLELMEHENKSSSAVSVGEIRKDSFFLSADGEEVESEPEGESSDEAEESEDDLNQGPNKVYHSRVREGGYEHRKTFGALNNQETKSKQMNNSRQKQPQAKRFENKTQAQQRPTPKGNGNILKDKPIAAEKAPVTEKLHPSWEAKRKLNESLQISTTTQNKKIKFDD